MTVAPRVRVRVRTPALVCVLVWMLGPVLTACARPVDGSEAVAALDGVAGYLVPWDPRSEASTGAGTLTEVSPVWFQPTETGSVAYASEQARASAAAGDTQGIPLTPSISNFRNGRWDGDLIGEIVNDPQRRTAHIAAIVDLVRSDQWRGVDIDYESLPASSRDAYSSFVAELATALDGLPRPARLSVALHAKTAEPGDWHGAQAQDWRAIGAAADEVRVMAYDYSSSGAPPGPIAPPSWVDQVLTFAVGQVPPDRIVLGLPTYGYDWGTGAAGMAVQWADVRSIAAAHAAAPRWSVDQASPWFRYTDDRGREHTIWYEDSRSLAAKLELARRYRVTKVVLWRLGGEDPEIWPVLRAARG